MPQQKTKKKEKTLLSIPSDYRKLIYQPNYITTAKYSYTLIQERIFTYIIWHLRTYTQKVMDGAFISQLDLFEEQNNEYVDINIPLNMIAKPYQYNEVRERALEMISVQIRIQKKNRINENIERVQGLITHVDIKRDTETRSRTGVLPIRMSKDVAILLLNIERTDGKPVNFTSFLFDVALSAENKYTPRIYKLLCSWRKKGREQGYVHKMKLADFREFLQLGDKYNDYEALKRRIITPVQQELKERADFWFEVSETREGKKVVAVNFSYHFPVDDSDQTECKLWNNIIYRLKKAWMVDDRGISLIIKLKGKINPVEVEEKMTEAFEWMWRPDVKNNPAKRVTNPSHYIIRTLLREFPVD